MPLHDDTLMLMVYLIMSLPIMPAHGLINYPIINELHKNGLIIYEIKY